MPTLDRMNRLVRPVLVALVSAVLLVLAPAAQAHDQLLESSPADGATLETAPEAIELTFSGEIAQVGAQVAVTGGDVESPLDGAPRTEGVMLVQDLVELGPGSYDVLWRVTSSDGHPISGSFTFAVAGDGAAAAEDDGDAAGGADDGSAAGAADDGTEDPAEAPAEEAPDADEPAEEPAESPAQAPAPESATAPVGIPGWAWVALGLAVVGLLAVLGTSLSRGRRR